MKTLTTLLALLVASAAGAQDLPWIYDVTGVASDDILNVRAAPDADSPILDGFPPEAEDIEVIALSPDGAWGKVGAGEGNGWVAMRFLERQADADPDGFFNPMICGGTEPFWALGGGTLGPGYVDPDTLNGPIEIEEVLRAGTDGAYATFTGSRDATYRLIVRKGQCSDGMSDREFGWAATLFITREDGNAVRTGCCTMQSR